MEETKTVYKMDKMDLRDVTIGNLDIYAECKDINIQRCNITELNNIGNMLKDVTSTVSSLHLWQNTNIGKMSIMNVVEEFKIEDSSINRLSARAKLFIDKLIVTDSTIENCYEFKKEDFKNLINKTSFAVSSQETRPILTGVNFKIKENKLECIATDSYRLAKKYVTLNNKLQEDINIVIPGRNLIELTKIIEDTDSNIEMHVFNNKVLFKFDNTLFQTRVLSGTFPDVERLIPESFLLSIKTNTNEFYNVIDRASLLTSEKEKNIIKFECDATDVIISSNSPEIGKVEERIIVEKNNEENIKIAFSSKYMMDAIKTIESKNVVLNFNSDIKPIIILDEDDDSLLQLILPIKTY